jgi:predicted nucleotidyltransferase
MHFFESSIITTTDCLHCQVYSNQHPAHGILVKPKYIPAQGIECDALPYRFIAGRKMNRLNLWIEKDKLKKYLDDFKKQYPNYIHESEVHQGDRLLFCIPIEKIERVYYPKKGAEELMSMPYEHLDPHLKTVYDFMKVLLQSGLQLSDLGITYSTLMGHYFANISDINIVVYGKDKYWQLIKFMETVKHPFLRWKTPAEWEEFYHKRSRYSHFKKDQFVKHMSRKRSEGFFHSTLFLLFAAERDDEAWFKWGEETYEDLGHVKAHATVTNDYHSVVRPGCYEVKDSMLLHGHEDIPIQKVVFYTRDGCMLAQPNEKIEFSGLLEKVTRKDGSTYYRVVVGYFDAYISKRREEEYIKPI